MRHEPISPPRLARGVFLGRKLLQVGVNGLTLTQSGYAPATRLPRHAHEAAYFSVVLSGGYSERVGTIRRERAPFSVAYHPAGEEHAEEFCPARSRTLGVELSPAWLERLRGADAALEASQVWSDGAPLWIAMRLLREVESGDGASALAIEGLVLELAAETTRASRASGETSRAPRWLDLVEQSLRAASKHPPSLSELAVLVGVHPVHVARTFRRFHGCTCGEFVRRLRLSDARARLASSTASLSQIALEAGFCDQSHFSRSFKRETGLTPREYRARIGTR